MLVNGRIPPNTTCIYSDKCKEKTVVCNGNGCPVSDSKTVEYEFSCAVARLFKVLFKEK